MRINNLIHDDTMIDNVTITIYAIPDDNGTKGMISFKDIGYSKHSSYQASNVQYKDVRKVLNSIKCFCNHHNIILTDDVSFHFAHDRLLYLRIDLDSNMLSMSNNDW